MTIIDLTGGAGLWIVETQPDRIFYITAHQSATGQDSSRDLLDVLTVPIENVGYNQ